MHCDSYLFWTFMKVAGAVCSGVCKEGLVNRLASQPEARWMALMFEVTLSSD